MKTINKNKVKITDEVPSSNKTCIICRKDKRIEDFNDEHVIPDSLNGYYHITLVCTSCNSIMGNKVDTPLINHQFIKFFRYQHQIKGKTGKIPIPLSGMFVHPENKNLKYNMVLDDENVMQLRQKPYVDKEKNKQGELTGFTVTVDSSDEESVDKISNTIMQRANINPEFVDKKQTRETIDNNIPFKGELAVDLHEFRLGLLKIAYEFAVDKIPKYFDDPQAKKISSILLKANFKQLKEIKMTSGFDKIFFEKIKDFFEFENRYVMILMPLGEELVFSIKFLDVFSIAIKMSDTPYLTFENSIIGINNLEKKSFNSYKLIDRLNDNKNPTFTRFQYFGTNMLSMMEINSGYFKYIGEDIGNPILYKKNGDIFSDNFNSFLSECHSENKIENGNSINFYSFSKLEPIFVKALHTGNFFQVVGFEIERKIHKV